MFNIVSRLPMYDQDAVQPMRDELLAVGFKELLTPKDVEDVLSVNDDKTSLVMINSVCGCAAGSARPGVSLALQHSIIPDRIYTAFAGQEKDAVDKVRSYLSDFPPSSPCVALFKNGKPIYFMQRMDIEGYDANHIANEWRKVFDEFCTAKGPSISPEDYEKVINAKMCGSKIPAYTGK